MTGNGVGKNPQEAFVYYEKAAKAGIPEAQFVVGEFLRSGSDIPQNLEEAKKWYTSALEKGFELAKKRLEQMALKNESKVSAKPGNTMVIYNSLNDVPTDQLMATGLTYFIGDKVPKDLQKAAEYVEAAAHKGLADAQYMIGKMCMGGQGVDKDYNQALIWLEKAAEQNHADANWEVARFYANGVVVEKDLAMFKIYVSKAASLGSKSAIAAIS
jgi:hypothetical protein